MAFKVLYHEDALADLEEIFEWSRERHPDTTELRMHFSTISILCRPFPTSALRLKDIRTSGGYSIPLCTSTIGLMRIAAALRFCTSGMSPAGNR
jgi:hypothetical protein